MRILLPLLFLATAACDGSPPVAEENTAEAIAIKPVPGEVDRSKAGETAPALSFEDPEGAPVTLADFRGKPLLVNLWATWCAPCVTELPTLDALAAGSSELQVLAISEDLEGREKVESFLDERGFKSLDAYLDPDLELMTALHIASLPTTILYDAEGREVWRITGSEDWTGSRAAALIREAGARKISPSAAR